MEDAVLDEVLGEDVSGDVVYLESSTDLTPVTEAMEEIRVELETVASGQMVLTGVMLGVMVILVLAVMFK